jgi:sec-independent protein translocase protein TatC
MAEEKVLPFMEHLIELRKRLIVCTFAIVIGMGVAWNYSNDLLSFVEKPLTGKTYLSDLKKTVYHEVKLRYPAAYQRFQLGDDHGVPEKSRPLNYSAPLEPFFVQCKISMLAGMIIVLPVLFHQFWLFVAPGLTRKERRLVVPFVTVATLSFCVGAMFNMSAYINFCLRLILVFGLIFELPILSLLLSRFGIVNYRMLATRRKYALLASAIIAAFHADLVTMFVIMVPMYMMYEISIWVALIFGKKRVPEVAEAAEV